MPELRVEEGEAHTVNQWRGVRACVRVSVCIQLRTAIALALALSLGHTTKHLRGGPEAHT